MNKYKLQIESDFQNFFHIQTIFFQYNETLTTESEIFLSLLMKFLDPDKPSWQNGSALEVIHKVKCRLKLFPLWNSIAINKFSF